MHVDLKTRRHPGKQSLLAYAENLVDNRRGIDRTIAAHLSACPVCHAEVKAVQASLAFAASAPELTPSGELTAQILMAGKQARSEMKERATPLRMALKVAQGGLCAAAMVLVAGFAFSAFLSSPEKTTASVPSIEHTVPVIAASGSSPEAARQAAVEVAAEIQTLSAAIQSKPGEALTPRERGQMKVVQARDDDTAAAMQALERDPRNARANGVLNANRESLRNIYVEGGSL